MPKTFPVNLDELMDAAETLKNLPFGFPMHSQQTALELLTEFVEDLQNERLSGYDEVLLTWGEPSENPPKSYYRALRNIYFNNSLWFKAGEKVELVEYAVHPNSKRDWMVRRTNETSDVFWVSSKWFEAVK